MSAVERIYLEVKALTRLAENDQIGAVKQSAIYPLPFSAPNGVVAYAVQYFQLERHNVVCFLICPVSADAYARNIPSVKRAGDCPVVAVLIHVIIPFASTLPLKGISV
jgi:hypothetical protein